MKQFNVEHGRKLLLDPVGGFDWALNRNIDESKARRGLTGFADSNLGRAIECFLVGFDEPAERLLEQVAKWVKIAIETNERPERYFVGATEAQRFQTQALCNWLLFNRHDTASLQSFVTQKDRYYNSQKKKDKYGVSLGLLTYVNASAFERSLEIFNSTPGLSPPKSLSPRNEAEMAYILSRHHLGLQYSRDDVQVANKKFLTKNIDAWLSNGQAMRAAEWMKILYWNYGHRTIPAKHVLMKCYDYLPGRKPPN